MGSARSRAGLQHLSLPLPLQPRSGVRGGGGGRGERGFGERGSRARRSKAGAQRIGKRWYFGVHVGRHCGSCQCDGLLRRSSSALVSVAQQRTQRPIQWCLIQSLVARDRPRDRGRHRTQEREHTHTDRANTSTVNPPPRPTPPHPTALVSPPLCPPRRIFCRDRGHGAVRLALSSP